MVDEEDVGVCGHRVGGQNEAPLAAVFRRLDLEMGPAVEALRQKLLEELAVEGLR